MDGNKIINGMINRNLINVDIVATVKVVKEREVGLENGEFKEG